MNIELTDWISCTTPPVRDGEYDVEYANHPGQPWRAIYRCSDGRWINEVPSSPSSLYSTVAKSVIMDHTMEKPELYKWRGVRKWVLVRGKTIYLERFSTRGVGYWGSSLSKAQGFETSESARRAASSLRAPGNCMAVQP